jgi:hypothetical protein
MNFDFWTAFIMKRILFHFICSHLTGVQHTWSFWVLLHSLDWLVTPWKQTTCRDSTSSNSKSTTSEKDTFSKADKIYNSLKHFNMATLWNLLFFARNIEKTNTRTGHRKVWTILSQLFILTNGNQFIKISVARTSHERTIKFHHQTLNGNEHEVRILQIATLHSYST